MTGWRQARQQLPPGSTAGLLLGRGRLGSVVDLRRGLDGSSAVLRGRSAAAGLGRAHAAPSLVESPRWRRRRRSRRSAGRRRPRRRANRATRAPSRITSIRSATSSTCGRLCEMKTTASPRSRTAPDQVEHLGGLDDAERRRRLVHDDHVRGPHRRPGDRDRLALPTGERGDRHPQVLDQPDAELVEASAVCRRISGWSCRTREPAQLAAEEDVGGGVQVRGQREVLVDGLDAQPGSPAAGRSCTTSLPSTRITPPSGGSAPAALDQGRLAGAVVADQRGDLSGKASNEAPRSARTCPKCFTSPRASSAGVVMSRPPLWPRPPSRGRALPAGRPGAAGGAGTPRGGTPAAARAPSPSSPPRSRGRR